MDKSTDITTKFVLSDTMPHGILVFLGAAFMVYGLTTPNPLETVWFVVVLPLPSSILKMESDFHALVR